MNENRDWGAPEDHQPVTWLNGHPIYAAHLVVLSYSVLMVVTAILGAGSPLLQWLAFSSESVLAGQVWRVFTYGLFNAPSLFFVLDMVMLLWFGRELEKAFGRRTFALLYGGIYLLPPLILTLVGLLRPTAFSGQPGSLAIFVGFATLFPGAMMLFNLMARWVAIILVALFALISLAERNWVALLLLGVTCGYAHLFVRVQQGTLTLPRLRLSRRSNETRAHASPPPPPAPKPAGSLPVATMAEVDALLDKIAHSGIHSLTPAERAKLDAARHTLRQRNGGS